MPRPPILPTINWSAIFVKGATWKNWLARAESPDNAKRMEEIKDRLVVPEEARAFLGALKKKVHVVAIAEDWCGDVHRHAPALQCIVEACPKVEVRFIARDTDPSIFARYLTNGGEAIPRFVFLSEDFVECGNWGPMPSACREFISRGKACGDVGSARKLVSQSYENDPGQKVVFRELLALLDIASSVSPDPTKSPLAALCSCCKE